MRSGLFLPLLVLVTACQKAPELTPPPAPAGEVWITARQSDEARLDVGPATERETAGTVVTSGKIAFDDLRVSHVLSPVTGRVGRIDAQLGQRVKKGDALCTIDSPDLGAASSDVAKAEADAVAAGRDLARKRELFAVKAVAERDVEAAEDAERKARAELDRARQKARLLAAAGSKVGQSFVLRAPIDGEIVARSVSPGMEVQGQYAGGGPAAELFTIGDPSSVWVLADVYEMDLARVRVGQRVTVQLTAYPDKPLEGTVDWVSGALDPATRTARIRCTLPNPTGELKPEMFASVSIVVDSRKGLAVPATAVVRLGEQTLVFVRVGEAPGGRLRFERRAVKIIDDVPGDWVPVQSGLRPGEAVVRSGAILLSGA